MPDVLPPLINENVSIQPHLNLEGVSPSPDEMNVDQLYWHSSTRGGCIWENKLNVRKRKRTNNSIIKTFVKNNKYFKF